MIVYLDGDDLLAKLMYYREHDAELRHIREGARMVARHHTWENRAHSLRLAIESRFLTARGLDGAGGERGRTGLGGALGSASHGG